MSGSEQDTRPKLKSIKDEFGKEYQIKDIDTGKRENAIPIENEFDIVRFIGSIHSKLGGQETLNPDMKLAYLEENQKQYIIDTFRIAHTTRELISGKYGKKAGDMIFSMLTKDIDARVVLEINKKENFLVKAFLRTAETLEPTEKKEEMPIKKPKQQKEEEDV